jgi:hypothetical protein
MAMAVEFKTSNHLSGGRHGKVIEYHKKNDPSAYRVIADCFGDRRMAELLSAAPNLLEAAELALAELVHEGIPHGKAGLALKAAIAKARKEEVVMGGRTGKRAKDPRPCGVCGKEILGVVFCRTKKADYHADCYINKVMKEKKP